MNSEDSSLISTSNAIDASDETIPIDYSFKPKSQSWFGRNCYKTCTGIVGKVTAAVATVGVGVFTYMGVQNFLTHGYSVAASLGTGAGIGFCIPVAIGLGLSTKTGKKVLDFMAKWSFWGMQTATQFALNAGFPISGIGLWDPSVPLASIVYGSNMFFAAMATCYLSLHLRSIVLKKADPNPDPLETYKKNRLLLECGTDNTKRFAVEQLLKLGVAGTLLTVERLGYLTAIEWTDLCYFLFGGVAGSTASFCFYKLKDYVEATYKTDVTGLTINIPWQTKAVRIVHIGSFLVSAPLLGVLFTIKSPYTLLGFGAIYSSHKISALRRFENSRELPHPIKPIQWKRVDTIAQGALVLLGCSWFIVGMCDPMNTMWDRVYLSSMIASALISYPLTRVLLQKRSPEERTRLINSLRFYIVDNPSLYLPYFIRRFNGTLGGSVQPNSLIRGIEDATIWAFFGATGGSLTAFNGGLETTRDSSPIEVSSVVVIACTAILASKGTLGGV